MKVLLISHYPPPAGGIASWTKRVLELGLPNGWGIAHINLNTINGRDPFQNTKIKFKDEYIRCMRIWKKEIRFLKTDKEITVVHTCIPCTAFGMMREIITGTIAKLYGKKFILHCRCTVPNVVNKKYKRAIFRILGWLCDGIMVLNQKSYDFVAENSKAYTQIIPNFISKDELIKTEKTFAEKVKNIVYVGGVTKEKGCDTIIEVANMMPDKMFHLVGIESQEITSMSHGDNVVFYGNQNKPFIKEKLKECDIFLFLSRYWGEGFSNALAEAMGAGLPCVVTDWAANADMIEEKGGKVIPQQDAAALYGAIKYYDANPDELERASAWNIEKVCKSYIDDVILDKYTRFYEQVIQN